MTYLALLFAFLLGALAGAAGLFLFIASRRFWL